MQVAGPQFCTRGEVYLFCALRRFARHQLTGGRRTDAIFHGVVVFLALQELGNVLEYRRMSEVKIECRPTGDTFVRFGVVMAALFGFAVYFFYDGHTGYRQKNEVICSFKAFAELGQRATRSDALQWASELGGKPLLQAETREGEPVAVEGDMCYPLPVDCEAARSCPPEVLDHAAMSRSWSDCWAAYSKRMRFPIKPGEHAYDMAAIREQWIAGGVFMLLGVVLQCIAFSRKSVFSICNSRRS